VKPYYQDKWVTIYHGDCREILIADGYSAEYRLMTDPPYNVGKNYGVYKDNLSKQEYQSEIEWLTTKGKDAFNNQMVFILGSKNLLEWWRFIPDAKLVVVRMGATSDNHIKNLTLQFHPILTTVPSNIKMPDLWEDIRWPGEGYFFNEERYGHPAMTPEKLAYRLVNLFSLPRSIIVDPYLGSGTFARVAKLANRFCIGIEIEEKYCEIAAKRCCQEVMEFRSVD